MMQIILVIIIIAVILIAVLSLHPIRKRVILLSTLNIKQTQRKNANKQKIMELFGQKSEIANVDIRAALKLDDRTIVRYMDELEKENKVVQIGEIGRNAAYRLKR